MTLFAIAAILCIHQVSAQYTAVPVPTTDTTTTRRDTPVSPTPERTTAVPTAPISNTSVSPTSASPFSTPTSPPTSETPTSNTSVLPTSVPLFSTPTSPPTSETPTSAPTSVPPLSTPTISPTADIPTISPLEPPSTTAQTPGPTQLTPVVPITSPVVATSSQDPITLPTTLTPLTSITLSSPTSGIMTSIESTIATFSSTNIVPPTVTSTHSPGTGPGTGPGSGYGDNSGSSPDHGLSRQSKLVIIIICSTLGCLALICVVSFLVHRWRQRRLRRVGRGGITDVFLANDGFMKLSMGMSGGKDGGKRESNLTEYKARAGRRESRGPNLIHEELGEGRYRSRHDPQGRTSNESKRSISRAMMNSRRSSLASSRKSSFHTLRQTPGPQGSSPSMVGEDFLFHGTGFYTADMLNGPHKVTGGSQASSLSGGRESRTFLRDSEYYHDDRRSYNTNSSRVSLGGSSTASDAYLLARDVYGYDEEEGGGDERIPLEEQVAFIKAQQQDMDRQRYEQQLWLDRMEEVLQERSDSNSGGYLSRTLLESDNQQSKSSTLDGELSNRSSRLHEVHEELEECCDMSDLGTSRPLSLDQESIMSERLTHNVSPTTTALTGELEYNTLELYCATY